MKAYMMGRLILCLAMLALAVLVSLGFMVYQSIMLKKARSQKNTFALRNTFPTLPRVTSRLIRERAPRAKVLDRPRENDRKQTPRIQKLITGKKQLKKAMLIREILRRPYD